MQSLRDVVYVEFYDVLEEDNFDPKVRQPMSNLRLLSHKTFEVKDLPFDKMNFVGSYSLLMPIDFCKKVAEFKFTARFHRALPLDLICKPLRKNTGYMLNSRLIFSKEFAINHDKALDKTNIWCTIKNLTQPEKSPETSQRLFFGKEILDFGENFVKVDDEIQFTFYCKDPMKADQPDENCPPFSTYHFKVTAPDAEKGTGPGFQQIAGHCLSELIEPVETWRATMASLDFNYIEDGSLGFSSLARNNKLTKTRQ